MDGSLLRCGVKDMPILSETFVKDREGLDVPENISQARGSCGALEFENGHRWNFHQDSGGMPEGASGIFLKFNGTYRAEKLDAYWLTWLARIHSSSPAKLVINGFSFSEVPIVCPLG
jgi:hypothetical protein